jgi:hypothetical protein
VGLVIEEAVLFINVVTGPGFSSSLMQAMDRTLFLGIVALLFGFLAGCSTVDSRIQGNPQTFASLSPADQSLIRRGVIREGLSRAAVYLAWGRPDRLRYGSRAGVPFEAWIYTTTRSEIVPGYYPSFYGFGYYRYGWSRPFYGRRGFYGYYPLSPYLGDDIVDYEVPYKTAFFEKDRCTGWEYSR